MAYRQLEPPTPTVRPTESARLADLTPDIRRFRAAYVMERRIVEQIRDPHAPLYYPSGSLSGRPRFRSLERKTPTDKWALTYAKLCQAQNLVPWQYVRVLFSALRYTDMPVPQVVQLASDKYLSLFISHLHTIEETLEVRTRSEYQRANMKISLLKNGGGHSFEKAVYYALVDRDLGLSPVFKYALATAAAACSRLQAPLGPEQTKVVEKLEQLGRDSERLAALDYAVFPELYDRIWGTRLPDRLRLRAPEILAAELAI